MDELSGNVIYGRSMFDTMPWSGTGPEAKMKTATDGMTALEWCKDIEKIQGKQKRNWRRSTGRLERKFRSVIDTKGRKGNELVLGFLVSIVRFRGFRDATR
jgi:hypothetical protein